MAEPRKRYPFRTPPELAGRPAHYPVVIAGAGPVGLSAARDLGLRGIRTVVLDDDDKVSVGSRAICWSKRTLEIFDRLGGAAPLVRKGVTWNTGKVFYGDDREPLFSFDLLPDRSQCFPAFINLQQYYVEEWLVDLVEATPQVELRWKSRVHSVEMRDDRVEIGVETPEGNYRLTADHLIAADGCRSSIRSMLGLDFAGEEFQDHFLIADIRMRADRPSERWFWFDPPFARGQSALLHKQPDDVWRLDFQLGWDIDRAVELDPSAHQRARAPHARRGRAVRARVVQHLYVPVPDAGSLRSRPGRSLQAMRRIWCRPLVRAAPTAACRMSTTSAGNWRWCSRAWRRVRCSRATTPSACTAARENLLHSTRSTDFITPKGDSSRAFRNAVLSLARDHQFARAYVNSGRLSLPCCARLVTAAAARRRCAGHRAGPGLAGRRRTDTDARWHRKLAALRAGRRFYPALLWQRRQVCDALYRRSPCPSRSCMCCRLVRPTAPAG